VRPQRGQEMTDAGDAAHGHHLKASVAKNHPAPRRQDFHRGLVAPAFHQDDPAGPADGRQVEAYPGHFDRRSDLAHRASLQSHHHTVARTAPRVERFTRAAG
jgi:hypothetical protein